MLQRLIRRESKILGVISEGKRLYSADLDIDAAKKIAMIGFGSLGSRLAGMLRKAGKPVVVGMRSEEKAAELRKNGWEAEETKTVLKRSRNVYVSAKPLDVAAALEGELMEGASIISVAAAYPIAKIKRDLGKKVKEKKIRVGRIMTNIFCTPISVYPPELAEQIQKDFPNSEIDPLRSEKALNESVSFNGCLAGVFARILKEISEKMQSHGFSSNQANTLLAHVLKDIAEVILKGGSFLEIEKALHDSFSFKGCLTGVITHICDELSEEIQRHDFSLAQANKYIAYALKGMAEEISRGGTFAAMEEAVATKKGFTAAIIEELRAAGILQGIVKHLEDAVKAEIASQKGFMVAQKKITAIIIINRLRVERIPQRIAENMGSAADRCHEISAGREKEVLAAATEEISALAVQPSPIALPNTQFFGRVENSSSITVLPDDSVAAEVIAAEQPRLN